ncbi:MAG TPA: hypothetical protein G4O11_03235 [Anaerolineae bacterium]|nr:hypothetical protein [Anaerolineae bacterium]
MGGQDDQVIPKREPWENEIFAIHRWGRITAWFDIEDERGQKEYSRLKELWEQAQPLDGASEKFVDQIMALEICNWNLEESILALCDAIGRKESVKMGIGHLASITDERWELVWAYYLSLRKWISTEGLDGYGPLLKLCDPEREILSHIWDMLGDRDTLKELYIERFCLCLERWLSGYAQNSAQMIAHEGAVSAIEVEIKKRDPESRVLHELVLKSDGDGRLQPCNHKAFRRYDLIISSIGAGKWRAVMPRRGTDGIERARVLEEYLAPIETWIRGKEKRREIEEGELYSRIHTSLGEQDNVKLFLASLLVSLLRSQQVAAKMLAESRTKEM